MNLILYSTRSADLKRTCAELIKSFRESVHVIFKTDTTFVIIFKHDLIIKRIESVCKNACRPEYI